MSELPKSRNYYKYQYNNHVALASLMLSPSSCGHTCGQNQQGFFWSGIQFLPRNLQDTVCNSTGKTQEACYQSRAKQLYNVSSMGKRPEAKTAANFVSLKSLKKVTSIVASSPFRVVLNLAGREKYIRALFHEQNTQRQRVTIQLQHVQKLQSFLKGEGFEQISIRSVTI